MTFSEAQIAALKANLDPAHIKKPDGKFGPKGDYIEGWHAINEANRIFGFDGWSYSIDLCRDDLREATDSKGNSQWQAAYTCICTVQAGGVSRQDVGFGSGFSKNIGDAIEGATKEAVTDALKRCLRTFGNVFGLALYDKGRANVGPTLVTDDQVIILQTLIEQSAISSLAFCQMAKIESIPELRADRFEGAKAWIEKQQRKAA
jgi:DNA recombination protein Rad52